MNVCDLCIILSLQSCFLANVRWALLFWIPLCPFQMSHQCTLGQNPIGQRLQDWTTQICFSFSHFWIIASWGKPMKERPTPLESVVTLSQLLYFNHFALNLLLNICYLAWWLHLLNRFRSGFKSECAEWNWIPLQLSQRDALLLCNKKLRKKKNIFTLLPACTEYLKPKCSKQVSCITPRRSPISFLRKKKAITTEALPFPSHSSSMCKP